MLNLLFYMFYALHLTDPSPSLLLSDNTSIDNTINDDNKDEDDDDVDDNDDNKVDKNKHPNMAKIAAAKKNKAAATAPKKATTKTTGKGIIDIDALHEEEAACRRLGCCIILDHDLQGVHGQPVLQGE